MNIIKTIEVEGNLIKYKTSEKNIKIIDSYKIKEKIIMAKALVKILYFDTYEDNRDRKIEQYIKEWRTHNILYKLPFSYFRKHCKDCDLTTKESKLRLIVYSILGLF